MATSAGLPLSPITRTRVVDQRLSMRVAAILPVELVFAGGDVLAGRSVDIGMGGICVATTSIIDAGAVRGVRLTLGRESLELSATSRWCSKTEPLAGFLFDLLTSSAEGALWGFIQERGRELAVFLRGCGGLEDLDFQDAFELAQATRVRSLQAEELVYGGTDSEEASSSIFVLFRGTVALERIQGRRNQHIASVKPGELFGGVPAIAGCTPFDRAVAVEDSSVLEFGGYNIEYLITAKPLLGIALLRAATFHWIRRFSETLDRAQLANEPAEVRARAADDDPRAL